MAQDYTPWLSWARDQEGKQLHILSKQSKEVSQGKCKETVFKNGLQSLFLLIYLYPEWHRLKIERQKCH